MEIEERKVDVLSLQLGMFVSRLDRPWTDTPFPLQGFRLQALSEIEQLRRYCSSVYIDLVKSTKHERTVLEKLGYGVVGTQQDLRMTHYINDVPPEDELPKATAAWENARQLATRFIDDVRVGKRLSADELGTAMEPIVASVIRSADAFFWLDTLRRRDEYAYAHSVNCCAVATTFGRHLGFPRDVLIDLASGGMLMDIGKAALPESLFNHSRTLAADEMLQVRTHVELSVKMLEDSGIHNTAVREMILHHHERHDGSGYPNGLSGTKIPLLGRMLGLVDTYDALCSDRKHQKGMARHHVLQALYRERDRLFQGELLEQFSQCLGVYPTGSLVELSSGEVAVVMAQNPARRLFPRVTILTYPDKTLDPAFRQVDLWPLANAINPHERVHIVRGLPAGAYSIDTTTLFL